MGPLLFTLLLAATLWCAWRLASNLLPGASASVFLLGFGLLFCALPAVIVVWLGLAQRLSLLSAWLALGLGSLLVWWFGRRHLRHWRPVGQVFPRVILGHGMHPVAVAMVLLFVGGFAIVVLNQLRYTVLDADSMWYHLALPAEWVRTGSIWPHDTVPMMARAYPGFRQAMVAWLALPVGHEHLALMGLLEYPLLVLSTYVLAREFGVARIVAFAVGFAAASTPVALAGFSTQGNDIALAIYLTAATALTLRFFRSGLASDAAMSGIALAALAASKFSGPSYCVLVVFACLLGGGARRLLSLRNLAVIGGCLSLIAAPWYVRNWIVFGNPLWPAQLEVAGASLPGPLDPLFLELHTMGFDLVPLLSNLHYFVDAHGFLAPLVAFGCVWVAAAVLSGRLPLRRALPAIALPVLLFVVWLQHPFNMPDFSATYSHRYLIAWYAVSLVSTAIVASSLLPKTLAAGVFALSAVLGFGTMTSLIWPVAVVAAVVAFLLYSPALQSLVHRLFRILCQLRWANWALLLVLFGAVFAVDSMRKGLQYDEAVGYRDSTSERGWGACVAYVHQNISGAHVGLHGSHFLYPLMGESWTNVVSLADQPVLPFPPKTRTQVLAWIDDLDLDYIVCCRERERNPEGLWIFTGSIGPWLLAQDPERFDLVFESDGAMVVACRRPQ